MPATLTQSRPINNSRDHIPYVIDELWTARQRQACSLHEISYRACFKPQLPAFFINQFTKPGDVVYDPFLGRGTTAIEGALLNRIPFGNDVNPLSSILTRARLEVPEYTAIEKRLTEIRLNDKFRCQLDLSMFFERRTLAHLVSLRNYLIERASSRKEDSVDRWIRMVATNRLTGHSPGFFSVYTLPPNQAATPEEQIRINNLRKQKPEFRDIVALILRKTRSLLSDITNDNRKTLRSAAAKAKFFSDHAGSTKNLKSNSVQLVVTSPPFLDIVSYAKDNWMRCWFNDLDSKQIGERITMTKTVIAWEQTMQGVFHELFRVVKGNGFVAFEVGEIRKGTIRLEENVIPLGSNAGFKPVSVFINQQRFTKTANIWGVANNALGTNTNRIVLFRKP